MFLEQILIKYYLRFYHIEVKFDIKPNKYLRCDVHLCNQF